MKQKIPVQSSNQLFYSFKKNILGYLLGSSNGQSKQLVKSQFDKPNFLLINGGHFIRENKFGGYIQSLEYICFVQHACSKLIYFHSEFLFDTLTSPSGLDKACAQFCLFLNSKAPWNKQKGKWIKTREL